MRAALFVMLACTCFSGCGGCAPELVGAWDVTWKVEEASGLCASEVGEESTGTLEVVETENADEVIVEGMGDDDEKLDGTIEGRVLTFGGKVSDDNGTTTTKTVLTLSEDGDSLSGRENWSWESEANPDACPDAESSVEATRADK